MMFEGQNVHFTADNKPLCSYSRKICKLRRLNGYAFCVRHILEDATAPYRQCEFLVKSTGQKCTSAIPVNEERVYCNAHMQVMGFIPKKERKIKKPEAKVEQTDSSAMPYLEKTLVNGQSDEILQDVKFSASKMFPELAGKLSSEMVASDDKELQNSTQKDSSLNSTPKKNHKIPSKDAANARSPNKQLTPRRRPKQPTRKTLSIMRKKQLGVLKDEEAIVEFSEVGFKAYKHFGEDRLSNADIVTPIIESSDDEDLRNLIPVCLSTKGKPTCLSTNCHKPKYDLMTVEPDLSQTPHTEPVDGFDPEFWIYKARCQHANAARQLNKSEYDYQRSRAKYLIDTFKDKLKCAVRLVKTMRRIESRGCHHLSCHRPSTDDIKPMMENKSPTTILAEVKPATKCRRRLRPMLGIRRATQSRRCVYEESEDRKRCIAKTVPLSKYCLKHILNDEHQLLFTRCSHAPLSDLTDTETDLQPESDVLAPELRCERVVIDPIHGDTLCYKHGRYELDEPVDPNIILRRPKKKAKPLALLRPSKKKKKKVAVRPQKPEDSSGTALSQDKVVTGSDTDLPSPLNILPEDASPEEDELISPINENIYIDDQDIARVLEDDHFENLFSDKHDLELTEEEQNLIMGVGNGTLPQEELSLPEGNELPDDITDVILHAESQSQHHHNSVPAPQPLASPTSSYNSPSYYSQEYSLESSYPERPPPEYPGTPTKLTPGPNQPMPSLSYNETIQYQNTIKSVNHHHQALMRSQSMLPRYATHNMIHHQPQYPLPSSSTLLVPTSNHNPQRLPPVASLHGNWIPDQGHYQNGFHQPSEHYANAYSPSGLPSPPMYHIPPRQGVFTHQPVFNNGAFSISHPQTPQNHQHINMQLQ